MMKYLSNLALVLLLTAGLTACSDYLEPKTPQTKPIDGIETVNDLNALMLGAYNQLSATALYGRNLIIIGDVATSNAYSFASSGRFIEASSLEFTADGSGAIWEAAYEVIANCNLVINSDIEISGPNAEALQAQRDQLMGAAYAVRALSHMILLKVYGQMFVDGSNLGIPYITTFAQEENFYPARPTVEETLQKIGADYAQAVQLLDPAISGPVTRMTYYGALALKARYHLFTEEYGAAADAAWKVINSGRFALIGAEDYAEAWARDGEPAVIFEIAMTQTDNRGINGVSYIVNETNYGDVEVTTDLVNLITEYSSDARIALYAAYSGSSHTKYRVVGKYPDRYKNIPVTRYAEVILTYAEGMVRRTDGQANPAEALLYLNEITSHRGVPPYVVATVENILKERRKELAMEGFYFWQRLRNGKDIVRTMSRANLSGHNISYPYGSFQLARPIPTDELNANPEMVQNQGYGGS